MRVLGISPLDKDATVSFLEDGRVAFACGEERLSRTKLQEGFPHRALQLGLRYTGWTTESLDAVAYGFLDAAGEAEQIRTAFRHDARVHAPDCTAECLQQLSSRSSNGYSVARSDAIPGFSELREEFVPPKPWWKQRAYHWTVSSPRRDWRTHRRLFQKWKSQAIADHRKWSDELHKGLKQYGLHEKLRRFRHHDTHAANSFYASGFEEALLVTLDGYGSGCCGGVYRGDRGGIHPLHHFVFPNSLGIYYEHVTSALGFQAGRHEGKIVGLAAYGDPEHLREVLLRRFDCAAGDIRIRAGMNHFFARGVAQRFAKRDVAAAYQQVLEDITQKTIAHWVEQTGLSRVAVSGGVHANVKLNQRIREVKGVEKVFVYPNMGDGGCATGAALLAFAPEMLPARPLDSVFYGPDYDDREIMAALEADGLTPVRAANIEARIAELLAQNHIVAHFHGRMEYGPRALGNRSILYPGHDPAVNQWLNHQLGRTEFMPFAPAVLAEHVPRLFLRTAGCEKAAEFMTVTFDCTDEMKRLCPAAVHVDGTARPQIVRKQANPRFHRILEAFYAQTGVPALINTSFNMHEEPIVCSPSDAVRAFLRGNMDYLAMGSFLVPHPRLQRNRNQRSQAGRNAELGAARATVST